MGKLLKTLILLAIVVAGVGWVVTQPAPLKTDVAAGHTPDIDNGALVFAAAGCASCHAVKGADDTSILSGGTAFASAFGTFYAPNISPGPAGIAGWDLPSFARAVRQGVSPQGAHYYPAFPYTAYTHMTDVDVADLFGYMQTLPASDTASQPHEVGFPFNIRRGLGVWKQLYMTPDYVVTAALDPQLMRGRYLVEALAHCGECHTPRSPLGGLNRDQWLTGAPNPSGKGKIPGITPAQLDWSEGDLVEYFTSGFTPEYDSVGGSMVAVVENLAKLPVEDRQAIAAYLKALP